LAIAPNSKQLHS